MDQQNICFSVIEDLYFFFFQISICSGYIVQKIKYSVVFFFFCVVYTVPNIAHRLTDVHI